MKQYDYLIVGAGLYGAVFAHEAKKAGKRCLVIDKRGHIAGNIYTEPVEGINVHLGRYGDEAEDKSLYATRFLEPESLGVKLANDGLIEIVYQCRKQKEYSVL